MNTTIANFVEASRHLQINGLIVIQDGIRIGEYFWKPEHRQNQFSISKSFTATAAGLAIQEGRLTLDSPVWEFFTDDLPENPVFELKQMTLRHLLMMSSGHGKSYLMGSERRSLEEKNWIKYALAQPFRYLPGRHFVYNNAATYLAGAMVQLATGQNLVDYLMPRLFEPLAIPRPEWDSCPCGFTFGAAGLHINVTELSRFGQLYLQNGQWQGRQLIPETWVKAATSWQIATTGRGHWGMGYGYQFWRGSDNSFRADGIFGQFCIMLPDKNAVIAINAHEEKAKELLDIVWREIVGKL